MDIITTRLEPSVTFKFTHTTTYTYSGPVGFGSHRLVMRPRENHYQRLESMVLTTTPPAEITWAEDIYGNMIATAHFPEAADQLVVRNEISILRREPAEQFPNGIPVAFPAFYKGIEEAATYIYRQSVYPPEVEAVRKWVEALAILPSYPNTYPVFDELTAAIKNQIGYQRREEPGVQSPKKTLKLGTGSCRDTAVLLMEAARSLGFAARFVSGYMESANSKVAKGSTHAWTEIYLPDLGWTGFDPSIGQRIGVGHIAVAVSHHPRGVMPISGSYSGNGNSFKSMSVTLQSKRL